MRYGLTLLIGFAFLVPSAASAASLSGVEAQIALLQKLLSELQLQRAVAGVSTSTVPAVLPSCTISASPSAAEFGDKVKVSWTSTNATKARFVKDTSGKDNLKVPSGYRKLNGSRNFKMDVYGNPSITMKVTGPGGSSTCRVTIFVFNPDVDEDIVNETPAVPTVVLAASPQVVQPKGKTTLTWSTKDAQRCVLKTSLGGSYTATASTTGTMDFYPPETTTYTLWCANDPGTGKDGPSSSTSTTVWVPQY